LPGKSLHQSVTDNNAMISQGLLPKYRKREVFFISGRGLFVEIFSD
jgi:hypothetical protein